MKFDEQIKRRDELFVFAVAKYAGVRMDSNGWFQAGYDAGFADAKEEMSYDVHTCHNKCTRLMCVQRREITELTRKLEVVQKERDELKMSNDASKKD